MMTVQAINDWIFHIKTGWVDTVAHRSDNNLSQRVFAIALGYEDLNDHDDLPRDQLLAVMVGKSAVFSCKVMRISDDKMQGQASCH